MSPLRHSTNVAARMGRWSARHRKTAIFGWLAFVVASFVVGTAVGLRTIDESDYNVGEARQGDHIIRDGGFRLDEQSELVLVESKTLTADDPAFRAVVGQAVAMLGGFRQVTSVQSPYTAGNEGQISKDGHAALIQFTPEGSFEEADPLHRQDQRRDGQGPEAEPGLLRRAGRLDLDREGARGAVHVAARACRAPVHPAHADHPAARLRIARRRQRAAPARAHLGVRDDGAGRAAEPDRAHGRVDLRGDPADRPRGRRRLLALLRPPRA